ncbi:MAG: FAD-dependent oxidoreductase [Inquilinaceae bacterium]
MTEGTEILIVGGGPVGLTCAWLLAGAGVPVRLVEAEPDVPDALRASTFHPPTLDLFDPSGITDVLIAAGRITPEWQIRLHETGERAAFDLSVLAGDTAHPYRLQCRQAVLSRELVRRLNAMNGGIVRFGARTVAVDQDESGVWADIETAEGDRDRLRARWLIGCDGARSLVREAMGVAFDGAAYPEHTILATTHFPFEEALEGLSGVNYIWNTGGTFSLLRLPDVWRCSFHPADGETPEAALEDGSIRAKAAAVVPDAPPIDIVEKRIYRVHHRVAGRYRAGRMLLAGDAAHLNSPKGGMGMNGGIHDAFNLAAKLTAIHRGESGPEVLDLYDRQRRPIARDEIVAQADANRARMNETDPDRRRAALRDLQDIAGDTARCHAFLLRSSMIDGLRRAAGIQ